MLVDGGAPELPSDPEAFGAVVPRVSGAPQLEAGELHRPRAAEMREVFPLKPEGIVREVLDIHELLARDGLGRLGNGRNAR